MKWELPKEVQALADAGALFVINDSAGKDSQAMKILLATHIPHNQLVIVHANLPEVEWEGNLEHIKRYSFDIPVHEVQAKRSLLQMVTDKFRTRPEVPSWPSPKNRQCTSDLKRGPIQKFIRNYAKTNGFEVVVDCLGLRAEESSGRAKKAAFTFMAGNSARHRQQYQYLPIHGLKLAEIWAIIKQAGQLPHYAYGLGMKRLSCCFCIMGCDSDLKIAYQHNKKLGDQYIALEEQTGYTMSMSRRPLKEIVNS